MIGIDSCASLPCRRNGECENKGVDGYACQCENGWLGSNCQYRFENDTFFWANKTGLVRAHTNYLIKSIYNVNAPYLSSVEPQNAFWQDKLLPYLKCSEIFEVLLYCIMYFTDKWLLALLRLRVRHRRQAPGVMLSLHSRQTRRLGHLVRVSWDTDIVSDIFPCSLRHR